MGHLYETAWDKHRWEGLKDKKKGPKRKFRRTKDLENRVLAIRFKSPEKDMYGITDILIEEGYDISARSVARVLSEHGVTLKKRSGKFEPYIFKGEIVNLDRHFISYFGKKRIGKDKHPTRNISMKGINASFTHDQETGDPIFVRADYPGLKHEEVAIPMLNTTRNILGDEMETVVFDKWFSVGSLLDFIDKEMEIKYVTLLKLFQNRIEEMKSIPAEEFREMADGRKITFVHTSLRNYQGEAKLVVIWFQEDGEDKYYGYLTNDEESSEERMVTIYGKRWGIENFLKEVIFLNVDKLPGTELNKISALLAIKLVGYCTVSCLRRDRRRLR